MFLVGELSAQFGLPILLGPLLGRALGICGLFGLGRLPGVGGLLRLRRAAGIERGLRCRRGPIGVGAMLGLRGFCLLRGGRLGGIGRLRCLYGFRLLRGFGASRVVGFILGTLRGLRRRLIGGNCLGFRGGMGIRIGLFRRRLRLGGGARPCDFLFGMLGLRPLRRMQHLGIDHHGIDGNRLHGG
ncbi:MAG: hypothetical protein QOI40_4631 [Alphaproteobacteria bacterium]|nr:hypothetical protein [Alphaproteobacteria bacterium]